MHGKRQALDLRKSRKGMIQIFEQAIEQRRKTRV